jgi:hypothetical protein
LCSRCLPHLRLLVLLTFILAHLVISTDLHPLPLFSFAPSFFFFAFSFLSLPLSVTQRYEARHMQCKSRAVPYWPHCTFSRPSTEGGSDEMNQIQWLARLKTTSLYSFNWQDHSARNWRADPH